MNTAYLSLGSNLGNRLEMLQDAVQMLLEQKHIEVTAVSSVYETDPVGYTEQAPFLNIVVEIKSHLPADKILFICLETEQTLGRIREFRWGPRCIDLDILLFNDENIVSEKLTVPHPRMHERGFVLVPLMELLPEGIHPVTGVPFREYVEGQKEGVHVWKTIDGVDAFVRLEN
ncbi:2-amino-4-hydroxy-6-hydroxymethyldihydropteridine diphosphokinase [Paenisporosarcina quisquiliarum]|uniref:2-amino-4-hydroxy-6-hydroxymethyldihydropteridine diphosphokinase n=1 Tax=Paenisporosarcina quisquiliarum TaxID=365346 RepID=A0A9X3LIR7_9BACL|nr:2-amino-4-hydroxy-6-hydroxymethyldihydropteridine diphosphokinase [Paenisporosarcina quisquiliarum]MCZ8538527.1 2-amino-4-hydroxy-6-hydroxymethyldihydropteridine diphosphokinase [Paenisporosarcina quisquiliarum]